MPAALPGFSKMRNAQPGLEFRLSDTHGILTRPGVNRKASSDGLGWSNAFVSAQREPPFHGRYIARPSFLAVFHMSGPTAVKYAALGKGKELMAPVGSIFLLPGDTDFQVESRNAVDTVHLYIRQEFIDTVGVELTSGAHDRIAIEPHYEMSDPLLEQLALELAALAADWPEAELCYVDQLAETFVMRLLTAHANLDRRRSVDRRRLNWRRLNRVIEYIDANIDARMSISDLAGVAETSPVYFARRFRTETGLAPHQFILRERVERAARLISTTGLPLAEIALSCGFCHQEHLTRAFRSLRGTTPAAYRRGILSG